MTAKSKRTQGPWFASRDEGNTHNFVSIEDRIITDVVGYYADGGAELPEEEQTANAQLIAAAPELETFALSIQRTMGLAGHNLNSTASREERSEFISRIINAWNAKGLPALEKAMG